MSEWTDKTRGMLEYFPNLPLRSDTRSWRAAHISALTADLPIPEETTVEGEVEDAIQG